jgi:hypothetical protein
MGLKGYRLWAMGQLDSTCRAPPRPLPSLTRSAAASIECAASRACGATPGGGFRSHAHSSSVSHSVALQVAFERQTLKPVFHLIGYRLWV